MSSTDRTLEEEHEDGVATTVAVHAEQIRTIYRQNIGLILVNPINAAIVAAVLWPTTSSGWLAAWVAAMALVTAIRAMVRRQYLTSPPPIDETHVWARRLVVGATITGMLWGAAGAFFYETSALAAEMLLVFVIGGMVAGASGTLALHLPAYLGFTAAAIVPTAARMLAEGDRVHLAMGGLGIVYGLAMSLLATNTNRAITEAFRLRFENFELLSRLSRAQVSLATANQTLEQRVAERGAALERQSEALRDAQRMESVGLLAGGIAHDFNNLLTVVLGNAELLLEDFEHDAATRDSLDEIRKAANRGALLVSQLLTFSRRQVIVRKVLDLNVVVSEVEVLLGRLIGDHIELAVTLCPGPLPVRADATQIQQTIINLATNARDAMSAGGTCTISTALVDEAPEGTAIPRGRYAVLSVRDTGVGMDPETKKMVFHPFFTTKEVGRGTGLGLATVYGIVEQSGGHVFVESEPGQGSCFRVYLPWVPMEARDAAESIAAPASAAAHRSATILVAEDASMVRAVTARVLGSAGYHVLEAEDGEQAIEIVRGRHIDLLVSDVVMARLGGLELASRIASERPELPILLVSGYSPDLMPILDDPGRSIRFLQKPFTPTELLTTVSSLLATAAARVPAAGGQKFEMSKENP